MNPYEQLDHYFFEFLPASRVIRDEPTLYAYGTDASFYRLTPKRAVLAESPEEISRILKICGRLRLPCTFRAAGTSLSGQSVTDSLLVMLGRGWEAITISKTADRITLGPGVIGARANEVLRPLGRRIGPDPASLDTAKIGGIAANNASGMCCGTEGTSYQTLRSMKVILADGTLLDTGCEISRKSFLQSHGSVLDPLSAMAARVRSDKALSERIRKKYRIKNTMGYSLNALVDFEDPIEILQHLMIGSEGTLGFIAEITLETASDLPHRATALVLFDGLAAACRAVTRLPRNHVAAAELMDEASLLSVRGRPGMPAWLDGLPRGTVALLIETRKAAARELDLALAEIRKSLGKFPLQPPEFTRDLSGQQLLWNVRKGLFPSIGAMRRTGTTVIIEDICFPPENLEAAAAGLQELLNAHGYTDAIVFGHARQGNLHFVFTPDFSREGKVQRYGAFMEALAGLVVGRFDGSLKAEHGTGRNMAPFVETEWGKEAFALMKEIKHVLDPGGILNPGVILNSDKGVHLKNLKPMPAADPLVDQCTECGFCEPVCPSRNLTFTPRQRIAALRALKMMEREHDPRRRSFARKFAYAVEATCAADGLCALVCPVSIDTGRAVKALRAARHAPWIRSGMRHLSGQHAAFLALPRAGLRLASALSGILGAAKTEQVLHALRRFSGDLIPAWHSLLRAAPADIPFPALTRQDPSPWSAVYFSGCPSRVFAPAGGSQGSLMAGVHSLLNKAGCEVKLPEKAAGLCCGLVYESRGFSEAADEKARELAGALKEAAGPEGRPVLFDTSPCLQRMREFQGPEACRNYHDPASFIVTFLKDRLHFSPAPGTMALHVSCSSHKMKLESLQEEAVSLCSAGIEKIPVTCCGAAGDKALWVPELTASALAGVQPVSHEGCSTSLTCELALSRQTGSLFLPLLLLADQRTQPHAAAVSKSEKVSHG